jgi:hypothetical protein
MDFIGETGAVPKRLTELIELPKDKKNDRPTLQHDGRLEELKP